MVLFHYASSADVIARFTVRRIKVRMGLQIVGGIDKESQEYAGL